MRSSKWKVSQEAERMSSNCYYTKWSVIVYVTVYHYSLFSSPLFENLNGYKYCTKTVQALTHFPLVPCMPRIAIPFSIMEIWITDALLAFNISYVHFWMATLLKAIYPCFACSVGFYHHTCRWHIRYKNILQFYFPD